MMLKSQGLFFVMKKSGPWPEAYGKWDGFVCSEAEEGIQRLWEVEMLEQIYHVRRLTHLLAVPPPHPKV